MLVVNLAESLGLWGSGLTALVEVCSVGGTIPITVGIADSKIREGS